MKLVDTSVAIDYLRDDERAVGVIEPLLRSDVPIVASEIVRFELLSGMRPDEERVTEEFFDEVLWIDVDEGIARLIAATAITLEADVLTTNVRHFPMLGGLTPAY